MQFADIFVYSSMPFINLYLVRNSIAMLESRADFMKYLILVACSLVLYYCFNCLHDYFTMVRDTRYMKVQCDMFKNLFDKSLSLDYEMLLDKEVQEKHELAFNIVGGDGIFTLTNNLHNFLSNLFIIFGLITVLSQVDIWILILTISIVMMNTLVTMYRNKFRRAVKVDMNPIQRRLDYFVNLSKSYQIMKDYKIYNMRAKLLERYGELRNDIYNGYRKTVLLSYTSYALAHIMNFIMNISVYLALGYKVLTKGLSIANFSMFLSAVWDFNGSISTIISTFVSISDNGQYLEDYFTYMNLTSKYKNNSDINRLPNGNEEYDLEFVNVSYKYPHTDSYVIKDLSFKVKRGDKIAVVGENGAGKTTMVLLIMGLIHPNEGQILLNGIDICGYNTNEYYNLFSTVFQDFNILSFTIKDNITALQSVDTAKLNNVINRVGLGGKISSISKGVDTFIDKLYDNEGIVLSGGEAQRVAIARALYKDAPIFILDEPTAALDPRIENEIYTKFKELTNGKTTFYITHRLASTHFCDKILVLKNGRLEESGSHKELIKKNGYYAELYNMQAQYYTESDESLKENEED